MKITKETNVPIPDKQQGSRWRLQELAVSESVFVECDTAERYRIRSCLASAAQYLSPQKFTVRMVDGGVRVWRLS